MLSCQSFTVSFEKSGSKICEQASPELFAVLIHRHSSSAKTRSWSVIADEDDYDTQEAQPGSKKKTPKSAKKSVPMLRQVANFLMSSMHQCLLVCSISGWHECLCMHGLASLAIMVLMPIWVGDFTKTM